MFKGRTKQGPIYCCSVANGAVVGFAVGAMVALASGAAEAQKGNRTLFQSKVFIFCFLLWFFGQQTNL